MDYTYDEYQNYSGQDYNLRDELDAWFLVSGDTDDFIFFGENGQTHSEK